MTWISLIIILSALLGLWILTASQYMVRASQGLQVDQSASGRALVLVELQQVFWTDARHDRAIRARVEAAVAREVALAQSNSEPVIALRQEWAGVAPQFIAMFTHDARTLHGEPGSELAAPFKAVADHVIVKRFQDGFETGELDLLLDVLGIGEVRLMGRDGAQALAKTAQAALNRGYGVTLIADGIATQGGADAFGPVAEALMSQGAHVDQAAAGFKRV